MENKTDGGQRMILGLTLAKTILELHLRGECENGDLRTLAILDYTLGISRPEIDLFMTEDDKKWVDDPTFNPGYAPYS